MEKKTKVYISGAITNNPNYKEEFAEAERAMKKEGFEAVNPVDNGLPSTASWEDHMRADLKLLLECDAVLMLKGWRNSRGAKMEYDLATTLGMIVLEDEEVG